MRKGSRDAEAAMQLRLRSAFDEFDIDSDGMLDLGELKGVLLHHASASAPEPSLSEDGVRLVLASIDKDDDSLVSFDEFAQWVCAEAPSAPRKKASADLLVSMKESPMPLLDEPGQHGHRGLAVGMIFHSKHFINKMPCVPPTPPPTLPSHHTAS